ncbi:hypothetical protein PIB30_091140 [Stylosanthes scabra]|uniref:Uncharacterized protein n=1 Tax=Stylosanthes scabra TaxID=79078 RepID=A0ABU6XSB1_9FABA|nr:hypothetical protein [Stylosanthes scabra]
MEMSKARKLKPQSRPTTSSISKAAFVTTLPTSMPKRGIRRGRRARGCIFRGASSSYSSVLSAFASPAGATKECGWEDRRRSSVDDLSRSHHRRTS